MRDSTKGGGGKGRGGGSRLTLCGAKVGSEQNIVNRSNSRSCVKPFDCLDKALKMAVQRSLDEYLPYRG